MDYLLCKLALNSHHLDFAASADHGLDAEMPEELGATSLTSGIAKYKDPL